MWESLRYILAVALVVLAFTKIASPYRNAYALPAWLYYGSAILELLIAALLLKGYVSTAAKLATAFFGIGMVLTVTLLGDCG